MKKMIYDDNPQFSVYIASKIKIHNVLLNNDDNIWKIDDQTRNSF